jgi:RHS repeat-associated protein
VSTKAGEVQSISVNGTTVLNAVGYEPFGGVNSWTWGDSSTTSRTYNGDGLISQIVTAGVTLGYTFDNASRITGISDSSNSALSWTYGYDVLDRLTSATTSAITDGWTYDANGNQLSQTGTTAISYTITSGSNQLSAATGSLSRSYSYDAAGNTVSYGSLGFTYNNRGRMELTTADSTDYLYNALGQMIEKSGTAGTAIFMQDESGHLIGEYDSGGNLVEETVWLGDMPVATLVPNGSGGINIFYVHTDHLNTPRKIAQPSSGTLAWRWDADPFGIATPNQNPAGLGTFAYNIRFPGQYYQAETGLNQNWMRDYDSLTGRYAESDPIGLRGGRNTYIYGLQNPISLTDLTGQIVTMTCRPLSGLSWFAKIPLIGQLTPQHCGVVVWHWNTCPQKIVIERQFSLAGYTQSPTQDPSNQTYRDDTASFYNVMGNNYLVSPPPGVSQDQFDAAVINSGANYTLPGAYELLGPNSNTAAAQIISGAGATVPNNAYAPAQLWQPPPNVPITYWGGMK